MVAMVAKVPSVAKVPMVAMVPSVAKVPEIAYQTVITVGRGKVVYGPTMVE